MKVEREFHHGAYAWTNLVMDELRRDQCLCLNCEKMEKCPTAKDFFDLCVRKDTALAVTRCPTFKEKTND